ncbi:MAG TPA: sugar-binding protein [Capsulimonadaceae bacterium]
MPKSFALFGPSVLAAGLLLMSASTIALAAPAPTNTHAGVDFYAADRLRMPLFGLSRNLVQNPGFEQAFSHWRTGPLGKMTESRLGEYYAVDETGGVGGGRCLRILGEAGQAPAHMATFAVPAFTGDMYTLSFYAKSDRPGVSLASLITTAAWGTFPVNEQSTPLSTEWKRYSYTFKSPNNVLSPDFGLNKPSQDCTVWLDNVQLERGPLTDYAEKPVGARFITSSRANLLKPSDAAKAMIEVSAKAGTTGTVAVTATSFDGAVAYTGTTPFTVPATGHATVPQPWADKTGTGIYVVEMNIATKDGFADRDFSRLVRMPDQSGSYPNKPYFAIGGVDSRTGSWERRFAYYQRIGIGSAIHFNPQNAQYKAIYQKHNILSLSSIFDDGEKLCGWNLKDDFPQHFSDEDLKKIEQEAYDKAAANLDTTYWKLINEPDGTRADAPRKLPGDMELMKRYITIMAAARRGVLRANPKAIIVSPDPAGMSPKGGIRWMETFLKAGGLSVADLIAIHPYRAKPEDPDLDSDIQTLFAMLDANGYHGDVWFTEGGGNSNLQIPQYNLDVYKTLGEDAYRAGMFTYDIGWAERLSAALCERQWLIGLKYHSRIKQYIDWYLSGNAMVDYDLTPGVIAFAPATLGSLLGDATYVRDITLGENLRGYCYKDAAKRPVIALWTTDSAGDHGEKTGPVLKLDKLPKGFEAFDMLGAPIPGAKDKLTVGPLPVFLRGTPGSEAQLSAAVEGAPMLAGGNRLRMWPEVQSATTALLNIQNRTRMRITGSLSITQPGRAATTQRIDLAAGVILPVPITVTQGAHGVSATVSYKPDDGGDPQSTVIDISMYATPELQSALIVDGDLSDWAKMTPIPITNMTADFATPAGKPIVPYGGASDLSGTLYTAWDSDWFYIAGHVVDNSFNPAPVGTGSYNGDSMQIYFDGFDDARSRKEIGFNGDDQSFTFRPDPATSQLDRTVAPDWQMAFTKTGPVTGAKTATKRTANGYDFECAIPVGDLVPMRLKAGNVFGFAVLVNDNDGDYRKRGLTLTPNGTEPFGHPELYPVFVLTR